MLSNPSIKWGLIAGGAIVILDLALGMIGVLAYSFSSFIAAAIYITFMVLSVNEFKNHNEGYVTFKDAFKAAWLCLLIAAVIVTVFQYLHLSFIDKGLSDAIIEQAITSLETAKGFLGEEGLDKMTEELEKNPPNSLKSVFTGLLSRFLFGALPAVIIAAIMKNTKSEFA